MNESQQKANDELTAAMDEFGIEESQLGADIRQPCADRKQGEAMAVETVYAELKSLAGGHVSLAISTTFVGLDRHDRRFVFYLCEVIKAYESGTLCFKGEEAAHPPSERKMDLSIVDVPDEDMLAEERCSMWNNEINPCRVCGLKHGTRTGRQRERIPNGNCPLCGEDKRDGFPYCQSCKNQYMRGHRPKYSEMSEIDRVKSRARAYLRTYIKRGIIKKGLCRVCGSRDVQGHHTDYSKPLDVDWLCPPHHVEEHAK